MLTKKQEEVLKYLLTLSKNSNISKPNQIMIGIGQYNFCNQSSQKNISILFNLEELGYIKVKFIGHSDEDSPCEIMLLNQAVNYEFYEKENKKKGFISSFRDVMLLIIGGIIAIIVEIIFSYMI